MPAHRSTGGAPAVPSGQLGGPSAAGTSLYAACARSVPSSPLLGMQPSPAPCGGTPAMMLPFAADPGTATAVATFAVATTPPQCTPVMCSPPSGSLFTANVGSHAATPSREQPESRGRSGSDSRARANSLPALPTSPALLGSALRGTMGSEHELPFQMEEEMQQAGTPDVAQAEVALGSFMMEVQAAPSLQLFGTPGGGSTGGLRHGAVSPLSQSVDDISSQLDRLSRTFHEGCGSASGQTSAGAAGAGGAGGCGGASVLRVGSPPTGAGGAAPCGGLVCGCGSLPRDAPSPRPLSRGSAHGSRSGHTSPSASPLGGSPVDNFLGVMPPPHLRQPLPVIAEPTYAEVVGLTAAPGAASAQPVAPRQQSQSQPIAMRQAAAAAAADGGSLGAAGEGGEEEEGRNSTERLLLSSSPPSESLFPFAPTSS